MALKDIQIMKPIENSDAVIFRFLKNNSSIKGIHNLVQRVIKLILTAKTTNLFNVELGTNFYNLFGAISLTDVEEVKSTIPILLDDLVKQIKSQQLEEQIIGSSLDDDELLENITLEEATFDEIFGGWNIKLNIYTKANNSIAITVS